MTGLDDLLILINYALGFSMHLPPEVKDALTRLEFRQKNSLPLDSKVAPRA